MTMNVAITCDIVRAMRSPCWVSRTMANASERGAAPPKPHATRAAMRAPNVGAKAAAMAPAA